MPVVDPTKVAEKPGHGRPYNWAPESRDPDYRGEPFPNALVQSGYDSGILLPITLRELTMLRFMNKVTDKPDWTTKVFDEHIIAKWKEESVNLPNATPSTQISEHMFTQCISELQHRAKEHPSSPNGAIRVYNGDVYKSDTAVSEATKLALQKAVRVLEDVPEAQKDWHPGSDGKVLDLVHPSLFPLIYGVSKILPIGAPVTTLDDCIKRCGEGEVLPDPKEENPSLDVDDEDVWSAKFQWLPCEVDISGEKPKIITYINNLHPQRHKELYGLVEELIHASIPLWNLTLVKSDDLYNTPTRIQYTECTYDPDPESWPESEQIQQQDGESDDVFWTRRRDWIRSTRLPELPEPGGFEPSVLERESKVDLKEMYGDLPLQVIVKLANIELTPEKPEYEGGTWHVEGKLNESICATAIYYYSSENITSSSLAFRHQANQEFFIDVSYEQESHDWLEPVFGLHQNGDTIQDVGSVETREGRLITFPNILQHQVQPFKLADPTKPGHRKIVALFLVDPNIRIVSTADVPCQRQDWWSEEVLKATGASQSTSASKPTFADPKAGGVFKLPAELQNMVFDVVDDFPIRMDKAKEYREKLMEERKKFVLKHQEDFAAGEISLCEH